MLHFFASLSGHALKILALLCIVSLLSTGFVALFTREGSRLRAWFLSDPERLAYLGIAFLFLAWLTLVFYNRVTGS